VLEALKSMNEITMNVRSESKKMSTGNDAVLAAMSGLRDAASGIKQSMEAMSSQVTSISASATRVAEVAATTTRTIERMEGAVGQFTV
jgi:methyl-accepting chemotaxis protein